MLRLISVAAGLAGLLIAAPMALAVEPARDEYTLDFPSVKPRGGLGGPDALSSAVQNGVVGENEAASSPLESTLATFLGAPLAVALVLLGALAYLLTALSRRYRQRLR